MPRKNVLSTFKAITNGDMSSIIVSPVTNVMFLDNLIIQLNSTGTPAGEYLVEFSADYDQDAQGNVLNAGNWVALALSPSPVITTSGTIIIDLNQMPASWMRLRWVPTSGTGVLNMFLSAKEI
jgi:hypothetical protein